MTDRRTLLVADIADFDNEIGTNFQRILRAFDGSFVETIDIDVIEDAGSIKLTLQADGGGDLTVYFAGVAYTLDCTPAQEIVLAAGTDTVHKEHWIYVTESGGTLTLTSNETGYPATAHAPVANVIVQSAASLAIDNAFKVHAWTDHLNSSSGNGHVSHLNAKLRAGNADHQSGTLGSDITSGQLSTTAGVIFQLHNHTMPARDMSAGDPVWIVNDPDTAYKRVTDFDGGGISKLSDGTSITNNRYINVVLWGVVSENEAECKLMMNLPAVQYSSEADAQADTENSAVYAFADGYTGVGFLIARYTIQYSTAGGGTITQSQNFDIRKTEPSTAPGGGGVDTSDFVLVDGSRPFTGAVTFDDDIIGAFDLLGDSSEQIVKLSSTGASAVNYIQLDNSNTGVTTVIRAKGTDTDVDMTLAPQGAGLAKYKASEIETVKGNLTSGTSFPGSPSGGQRYTRTDHGTEGTTYTYNAANSIWLGPRRRYEFGSGRTGQNNTYLGDGNAAGSGTKGVPISHDMAIVEIEANWEVTATSGNIRVRRLTALGTTDVASFNVATDSNGVTGNVELYAFWAKHDGTTHVGCMTAYLDTLNVAINRPTVVVWACRAET